MSSTSRARCFSTGSPKRRSGYMPPGYPPHFRRTPRSHTRRGSTSMRRRPLRAGGRRPPAPPARRRARSTDGRPQQRTLVPSATGPEDGDAAASAHRRRTRRRPPRRRLAPRPARRTAGSRAPDGAGSRRRRPACGSPSARRLHHLVLGQPGLQQEATRVRRSGVPEQPGAADEQPERLLGGPGPRREELLVELQVGDQPDGRAAPAIRCSTASVPMSTGTSGTSSVAASTDPTSVRGSSAARSSRTAVIPGRTARNVRAVAVETDLRTRRRAARGSRSPPPVARPSRRRPRSAPARGRCDTRADAPGRAG